MTEGSESPIVILVSRTIAPFIQLFGLYVIFHGHYGPGGGFQGGAMLAASVILMRLCVDRTAEELQFRNVVATPLGIIGAIAFVVIGLVTVAAGGTFLDYSFLPLPWLSPAEIRSLGILLVECGIGLAVMATLVSIFDSLVHEDHG